MITDPFAPVPDCTIRLTFHVRPVVLSDTEKQVLQLIAEGFTNPEIAAKIFKGRRTVDAIRLRLIEKAGVPNSAALVLWAVRQKIIE